MRQLFARLPQVTVTQENLGYLFLEDLTKHLECKIFIISTQASLLRFIYY